MAIKDEPQPLHILFFPFLAPGHLIPIADMAAVFAARGVRCSILTTPANASLIRSAVDRANSFLGSSNGGTQAIDLAVVPFPDVGLPPGAESSTALSSSKQDRDRFHLAVRLLREPFDRFLSDHRVDAVVADSFFMWAADAADVHGVPRLAFLGTSVFARSCTDSMLRHNPVGSAPEDDDPDAVVSLPGLPHRVEFTRELARGLDFSGKNFVWGWAPQVLILNHPAVGVFVMHCGWNSMLEAVTAGVPMVTWPRYADQFYNEKLVTEVLKVGVGVGSVDFASKLESRRVIIGGEVVAGAIGRVMGDGEEGEAIRRKSMELGTKARQALEKGASSYDDVGRLMDELMARRSSVNV
uniref:Uncharacterized protein n=1 Tax=Leersia perrieri TaxID=77586 RepID=A0A0D9V6G2_9ORYZ